MLKGLRRKASLLSLNSTSSQQSSSSTGSSASQVVKQVRDFEIALQAMDYLLDDRTDEGLKLLEDEYNASKQQYPDQPAAIFPLALGVMEFIEATLGFEPEVMIKAHNTLSAAENASTNHHKHNLKIQLATSKIYPPGTEFQVTQAESTLLNALVMLLTENNGMLEGAKALLKLRRAYQALDAVYKKIKSSESVFNNNIAKLKKEGMGSVSAVDLPGYQSPMEASTSSLPPDLKLIRDLENVYNMRKARVEGTNLGNNVNADKVNLFEGLQSGNSSSVTLSKKLPVDIADKRSYLTPPTTGNVRRLNEASKDPGVGASDDNVSDDEYFSDAFETPEEIEASRVSENSSFVLTSYATNVSLESTNNNHLYVSTVDEFIHSGVQLCFGILQVVLSLIPPTIGKVLSIVGFKGDRDTGLRLLWRAAITTRNIHSELAFLCLLVFYDGPIQFVDTGYQLPGNEDECVSEVVSIESLTNISEKDLDKILANPSLYTPQLLKRVSQAFPHNALWILQEGRMLASQKKLDEALQSMQSFTDNPETKINMKQAEALLMFDRAMLYCFNHDFDKAARDFINLVEINTWSQGVYLYIAGSCYLEKWRMIKLDLLEVESKERELKKYSDLADKYFKLAPTYVSGHGVNASKKKGGIGGGNKQMPFDKFILRKLAHVEANQRKDPEKSFIECFGTSPLHEIIYFWNGYNRMTDEKLELSIKLLGFTGAVGSELSYNTKEHKYTSLEESEEESMIRYLLQSICLRSLKKVSEGLALLDNEVLSKYIISDQPQFRFDRRTYSPYLYPTALYEKSMFVWLLRVSNAKSFEALSALEEAKSWIKKAETVSDVGDYELSNRTSMRIKAACDRVDSLILSLSD